jgi:chromosome segregation ATPase
MWIPISIRLINFQTHVDTEYFFQQGKVTLFQGINYDMKLRSNGSGKSTILEAVSYAILGSALKKTNDSDLIRNGEKNASIRFELRNSRNGHLLVIEREINLKSSSKLNIWLNGIDQKDKFATIPDGDKLILQFIGINRKDLLNYYLISKEKYVSYYSSSDTDKKDVISRFSKANRIDGIDNIIQIKLDEFDSKIKKLNDQIIDIDATIRVYNTDIETEKTTDREKLKNDQIQQYQDQIVNWDYQKFDKEYIINNYKINNLILNNHIKRYNCIIEKYKKQIELLKSVDYTKELGEIDVREGKVKKEESENKIKKQGLEKELDESNELLREITTGLKGLIECPKCKHEFIPDEEFNAEEARENKLVIEEGIKDLQKSIDDLKENLKKYNLKYQEFEKEREIYRKKIKEFNENKNVIQIKINRCNTGIKNINNEIKNNNTNISSETTNIENLIKNIDKTKLLIKELEEQTTENEILKIENKIKEQEVEKTNVLAQIVLLEEEKFKNEQWKYNFVKFKSFLANKSIKIIEGLSNLTLKRMGSDLQVQLEGYKLLKSNELREKITATILRDGFPEGSFFKFSGGEKGSIEIATISALQQLINFNAESGGFDLLWIDEILESVDGIGMIDIAKAVSKLNKTVEIITHVNIPVENDYNIVTIEKRNKISKIL